jgi:hypothetical protein
MSKSLVVMRRTCDGDLAVRRIPVRKMMSQYMLLLYAPEVDEAGLAERWAEMPLWMEITENLRKAGLLIGYGPLNAVDTATTVRVRNGDVGITDGPFAVTKEVLVGYYLLNCSDLDEALRHAATLPTARYGSVEVRPMMEMSDIPSTEKAVSERT